MNIDSQILLSYHMGAKALYIYIYLVIVSYLIFYFLKNCKLVSSKIFHNLSLLISFQTFQNNYLPGFGITPTLPATASPRDLAIARPGIFSCFSQTLNGPTGSPL